MNYHLNSSFDVARPYSRPTSSHRKNNASFSKNKSLLDNSYQSVNNSNVKYKSFSPTLSLAEYNQVKFAKNNQKSRLPDLNVPQRVDLPLHFNTPLRERTKKPKSRSPSPGRKGGPDSSFVSEANNRSVLSSNKKPNKPGTAEARTKSLTKYTDFVETEVKVGALRRLRDLTFIAQACKRAGKIREEGRAYYSTGVLYDNLKEYNKAIQYYKKFLSLCRSLNDINGEALAYNCLGVDYQLLGDMGNPAMYQQALKYHEKHKDIGNLGGKFTACINQGLLYSNLGDEKNAIVCQQQALRLAAELSDVNSQGIAIGSLGKIGTLELAENKTRMLAFVEKYLRLCKTTDNRQGEGNAYLKLGQILSDEKNYSDGIKNYERALDIGRERADNDIVEKAKLGYGIAMGMSKMDTYLNSMKEKFTST